ncbi:MAG: dTMP kinase [Candidatus Hydrogenedentota bacterium]
MDSKNSRASRSSRRRRGIFISFEGPDGAGKTTHARLLAELLGKRGHKVVLTREPGGTPFGEQVREILLDPATGRISHLTELLLYESIRAHHVESLIVPALKSGKIVICDRFTDASLAYQGYGRGLPAETVRRLNEIASSGLKPDITILLDIDSRDGLDACVRDNARSSRRKKSSTGRLDRIESAGAAFHRRVRRGYLRMAAAEPRRFMLVKRAPTLDDTFARMIRLLGKKCPGLRLVAAP